jgi:hypothetical protein
MQLHHSLFRHEAPAADTGVDVASIMAEASEAQPREWLITARKKESEWITPMALLKLIYTFLILKILNLPICL